MDTETFLVERERLGARLMQRREDAIRHASARKEDSNGLMANIPFLLRFAATTLLSGGKMGGFWPKALFALAPMAFGLAKSVTGHARKEPSALGTILGFFPIVKSLIKRYN